MTGALYVVDCSVSMGWLLEDQSDAYCEKALDRLAGGQAIAPAWWSIEVLNVLLSLERRKRLASGKAVEFLRLLQALPIRLHESKSSVFELHALAIRYGLTSYDALYLDAALASGLPVASRDKALCVAAKLSGVGVWRP